jgi:hypothetical protein
MVATRRPGFNSSLVRIYGTGFKKIASLVKPGFRDFLNWDSVPFS